MADPRVLDCIAYFKEVVGESTTPSIESLILTALQLYQYEQDKIEEDLEDIIKKMSPGGF